MAWDCFRFVMKTVLIARWCFGYCWALLTLGQGLFCSSHHEWEGRGCRWSWEGTGRGHGRDSWSHWPKGYPIPYRVIFRNKNEGVGACRGCSASAKSLSLWWWVPGVFLQELLFLGLFPFCCYCSFLFIKLSLFQPANFVFFTFPSFSPPSHWEER